ncbi:MAG TPA: ADP-ribosylglycohydrolase family protein, partial [Candidatus Ozemobacteraceae bacterium]|nr:ADP-ribosylglycohydrolase family protein [Candidatus Ozemobacteraceae bacterium]
STRITHTDPRVVGCAIVLATVVRLGLEGADPNPETVVTAVLEKAQVYAAELMRRLKLVKDLLRVELLAAVQQIGNGGFCLESVPLALHCFLRYPRKFDEMIVAAANVGGDSDAIAAMAGAMFGAFHGIGAISSRWLDRLENVEKLKQTGADLYRMTVPNR